MAHLGDGQEPAEDLQEPLQHVRVQHASLMPAPNAVQHSLDTYNSQISCHSFDTLCDLGVIFSNRSHLQESAIREGCQLDPAIAWCIMLETPDVPGKALHHASAISPSHSTISEHSHIPEETMQRL